MTADERANLDDLPRPGKASALVEARARTLLKADKAEGGQTLDGETIADELEGGLRAISRNAGGSSGGC